MEGLFHFASFLYGIAGTLHPDGVDAHNRVDICADHKGRKILRKPRMALAHHIISDPHELVKGRTTPDKAVVTKEDVPAEQDIIGEGVGISDNAIVSDMRACHEVVVVAEYGIGGLVDAAMDRYILPQDVSLANEDTGTDRFIKSAKLRVGAENGTCAHEGAFADLRSGTDLGRTLDDTVITDSDALLDDRKGTYFYAGA